MRLMLIAAALAAGSPPAAQAQPSAALEAEAAADEQQQYGEWLQRLQAIYFPVFSQFQAFQVANTAGQDLPAARRLALLRPLAAEVEALTGRAEADLAALQQPRPSHFVIAPELQPPALVRELSGAMGGLRTIVSGTVEVLEHASARRVAALEQSSDRVVRAIAALTRTNIRLAEARMNAHSEDYAGRYIVGMELATQKLSQVLLGGYDKPGPALGRQLSSLADQAERWVDIGLAAADKERLKLEAHSSSATVPAAAAMLSKALRVVPHQRAQLEIGRELVALIRKLAGEAETAGFQARLLGHMDIVRAITGRMVEHERQVASILSAP